MQETGQLPRECPSTLGTVAASFGKRCANRKHCVDLSCCTERSSMGSPGRTANPQPLTQFLDALLRQPVCLQLRPSAGLYCAAQTCIPVGGHFHWHSMTALHSCGQPVADSQTCQSSLTSRQTLVSTQSPRRHLACGDRLVLLCGGTQSFSDTTFSFTRRGSRQSLAPLLTDHPWQVNSSTARSLTSHSFPQQTVFDSAPTGTALNQSPCGLLEQPDAVLGETKAIVFLTKRL